MTPKQEHTLTQELSQTDFYELLQAKLREAVRYTLIMVLETEVEALIGAAPYQRIRQRRDHRNGYYTRDLVTGVGLVKALSVSRTRPGAAGPATGRTWLASRPLARPYIRLAGLLPPIWDNRPYRLNHAGKSRPYVARRKLGGSVENTNPQLRQRSASLRPAVAANPIAKLQ